MCVHAYPPRRAIAPINERLSVRIVPSLRGIYAEGDMVIALWDGTATAKDGKPYTNIYSWYMTMKNGRIVKAVAFFDTIELTDLWNRIPVSKISNMMKIHLEQFLTEWYCWLRATCY
ncbi:hypothetical protein [Scytonema sp. UIC 10036]|uniref:nuclear transport factor 2 family protein n=1 Tax=Scytonema sp. UIC 10036 TaxID=2304196 RepID=UPI001A9ACC9F|nr:hypothetical protein [Scytonema sp. UIC 10036]